MTVASPETEFAGTHFSLSIRVCSQIMPSWTTHWASRGSPFLSVMRFFERFHIFAIGADAPLLCHIQCMIQVESFHQHTVQTRMPHSGQRRSVRLCLDRHCVEHLQAPCACTELYVLASLERGILECSNGPICTFCIASSPWWSYVLPHKLQQDVAIFFLDQDVQR
jgi:hypothetical protein